MDNQEFDQQQPENNSAPKKYKGNPKSLNTALLHGIAGLVLAGIASFLAGFYFGGQGAFGNGMIVASILIAIVALGLGVLGLIIAIQNVRARLGRGIASIICSALAISNGIFALLVGFILFARM